MINSLLAIQYKTALERVREAYATNDIQEQKIASLEFQLIALQIRYDKLLEALVNKKALEPVKISSDVLTIIGSSVPPIQE